MAISVKGHLPVPRQRELKQWQTCVSVFLFMGLLSVYVCDLT